MMSRLRVLAPVALALLVAFPAVHAAPAAKTASNKAQASHSSLATDRQKTSYAMGMKLGNDITVGVLQSIKDDIDAPTVLKTINVSLAHGQTEMTPADAEKQLQAFDTVMKARQEAAKAGKPAPAHNASAADKHKLSYALGMKFGSDLARVFEQAKADIDQDVAMRGFNAFVNHGATEMTVPEAQAQLQAFVKGKQAKQAAANAQAAQKNKAEGDAFLAANAKKPGVKVTASGLQYTVDKMGTGQKPTANDRVSVTYTGSLIDGTVFDSTDKHGGAPATFGVGGVIPGWTEGLQLMPVGSKFTFWIPGKLGYGDQGMPGSPIGPGAMLKFEVELKSIDK